MEKQVILTEEEREITKAALHEMVWLLGHPEGKAEEVDFETDERMRKIYRIIGKLA